MSATRMTFRDLVDRIPAGTRVEVWGDSTVWLVGDGRRIRLRDYLDQGCPPAEEWPRA